MSRFSRLFSAALILLIVVPARAQTDAVAQARAAMANGDYPRAANILSAAISTDPSADAYVYLGISYAHMREWQRAEDTFKNGADRYPQDPRFHNELAGVYLAANDLDQARRSLKRALAVDPANRYASDLLATVDMSMGNVEGALDAWNKDGRPLIGDILHNGHVEFENWTVAKASTFKSGEMLTWSKWRTTEVRLRETGIFSNAGLDIEPTPDADRYTAVIRTSAKGYSTEQLIIPLLETAFFRSPTLNLWNIRNSAASVRLNYRFATNRHRAEVGILAPLPLPGILFLEAAGTYRSERWDISRPAIDTGIDHRFRFQSTGARAKLKYIPQYRFELGAGFEYRNRTASGSQPGLALDSRNTGKLLFDAGVLVADGRFRSRVRGDVFIAREAFLSDIEYSGGTVEWNNYFTTDAEGRSAIELTLKSGASRGELPIDDYFVLGVRERTNNILRGHDTVDGDGHFGYAPMGTSFTLGNATFDRRIRRLPFFNVLNFPYVDLKWLVFVDAAKVFDRAHVFEERKIHVDVGGGFKLETPTRTFNLTYGRSLRDGTGILAAYVGRRWQ